jgi:PAS domain-containing protein
MDSNRPIAIRVRQQALDDPEFPLGVIRIAPDGTVQSMNRAMREIVAGDLEVGAAIRSLNMDEASRAALERALEVRFAQERGSAYPVSIHRRGSDTVVRGRVAALPEYDSDGLVRGSIGFVLDETIEATSAAIHGDMEKRVRPDAFLRQLTERLRQVIAFDCFMVTAIGRDGNHLRPMFDSQRPQQLPAFRWWPMPAYVKEMMRSFTEGPYDLDDFFDGPDGAQARQDPAMEEFRERGFRHSLRLKVRVRGADVAVVSMFRARGKPAFDLDDLAHWRSLPAAQAISWMMDQDAQLQQLFSWACINRMMRAGPSAVGVAQRLVDDLWRHFKWAHVSIFRIAEDRGRVVLVSQAAREQKHRLPDGYEQSLAIGLLGKCAREGRPVISGNVGSDRDYHCAVPEICSELVLPLRGARVQWLLNVESRVPNAFAQEDADALARLLRVATFILEHVALVELHETIMANVGDAIIETGDGNAIRSINGPGLALLGYAREQMVRRDLASFLEPTVPGGEPEGAPTPWPPAPTDVGEFDAGAGSVLQSEGRTSEVARFVRGDGSRMAMLVSVARNTGVFGGKILVASDLSGKQFLDRVERLTPIVRQLASEIRVPLALASNFVEAAAADAALPVKLGEQLQRAQEQITAADVSVDRLVQAAAAVDDVPLERSRFDLQPFLERVRTACVPESRQPQVGIHNGTGGRLLVRGASEQLKACVETLLALLLRAQEPQESVRIEVARGERQVRLMLRLAGADGAPVPVDVSQSAAEMLMVGEVVPSLMRRMGGRYEPPTEAQPQFTLVLSQG